MPQRLIPKNDVPPARTKTSTPKVTEHLAPTSTTAEVAIPVTLNRKGTALEILQAALDIKQFQNSSIWLYIVTATCLPWLFGKIQNYLDLWWKVQGASYGLKIDIAAKDSLLGRFWEIGPPLAAVGILGALIWLHVRKNIPHPVGPTLPDRRRALIFLLSPYSSRRNPGAYATADELRKDLNEAGQMPARIEAIRQKLLLSNWGPLVVAAEYHRLTHLFLVVTSGDTGSAGQEDIARDIFRAFRPKEIREKTVGRLEGKDIPLIDANDLEHALGVFELTYRIARFEYDLPEAALVADLTGGTAVMSSALAMTCQKEGRAAQYLRQDRPLTHANGTALTADEIEKRQILCAVPIQRK